MKIPLASLFMCLAGGLLAFTISSKPLDKANSQYNRLIPLPRVKLGQTSKINERFLEDKFTQKNKNGIKHLVCKTKGGVTKLVGFDNIDKISDSKKKDFMRKSIDPDTPMLILKPKPVIVAPIIIKAAPKPYIYRSINHNYV